MNNIPKWKLNIIKWLAGGELIMINFVMHTMNVKDGKCVIYVPLPGDKITKEEAAKRAVLVPVKSII